MESGNNNDNEDDEIIDLQDDYPDTIATTGLLTVGGNISGAIEESFDRDWFQVSLTAGDTYKAQVTSEDITPFIALYDANGTFLEANYSQTRFGGDLDFTVTDTGTYYLGVYDVDHGRTIRIISSEDDFEQGYSRSNTGNYTISVLTESISLLPADRIFNWAESTFPDLLPNHPDSIEVLGYYARIYDNGNAVGEQDSNLYFYNGDSIVLVGAVNDYLSYAIDAGF